MQRVKDFATFLGRSAATAEAEDVRRFRLHLTATGAGTPKINATVAAFICERLSAERVGGKVKEVLHEATEG